MEPILEIVIPIREPGASLALTIASLVAQTDRGFAVIISDTPSRFSTPPVDTALRQLAAAGISVRRAKTPGEIKPVEHLNWASAQATAAWTKPLLPGEQLKPEYVARIKQRIADRPNARVIRCDWTLITEWGPELFKAPFAGNSISIAEFANFFPSRIDWLFRSINITCHHTAWLAMGGYSPQLPNYAALNLHVLLTLHYGMENIAETLATADASPGLSLNETLGVRVNHSLELWLILRQIAIYCRATGKPWPAKWLFLKAMFAALRRR